MEILEPGESREGDAVPTWPDWSAEAVPAGVASTSLGREVTGPGVIVRWQDEHPKAAAAWIPIAPSYAADNPKLLADPKGDPEVRLLVADAHLALVSGES